MLTQTLPDPRACPEPVEGEIHTIYDANGNVASITLPSRPPHVCHIEIDCSIRHTTAAAPLTLCHARDYLRATSAVLQNNQGEASDVDGSNGPADDGRRGKA